MIRTTRVHMQFELATAGDGFGSPDIGTLLERAVREIVAQNADRFLIDPQTIRVSTNEDMAG